MKRWITFFLRSVLVVLAAPCLWLVPANAQPQVPVDVGQTVNGFQDDFNGSTLGPDWKATGTSLEIYSVADGLLKVASAVGNPNHLLYTAPGYDPVAQEVLARIRLKSYAEGYMARAGVAVGVDTVSSEGLNFHFRDLTGHGRPGRDAGFSDDFRGSALAEDFDWQQNAWYWLRLRRGPDDPAEWMVKHAFAKIWPADGSTAEPTVWRSYGNRQSTRTGLAGIAAGSGATSEFEVDYILIKAEGLPEIVVDPEAFPLDRTSVVITNQPLSQSVGELLPVAFGVGTEGYPQPQYQWFRNAHAIRGATNDSYRIPSVGLADDQAVFMVVARNTASNITRHITSSAAVLTVIADTTAPTVISATAVGTALVQVTFSERLEPGAGVTPGNFSLTSSAGPLEVLEVSLDPTETIVALKVSAMTEGTLYTLTVNRVTDQAAARNPIVADSQITFTAAPPEAADIGDPSPTGTLTSVAGGHDLTAGGSDVGGVSDQFFFAYLPKTGDFDLQVRLDRLDAGDLWAKAGLMARATVSTNSPFAAVFGTVGNVGAFFQTRAAVGGPATSVGSFPVNYPDLWLRLKRAGILFTGYAGWGGGVWTQLGSTNISLPPTIQVGFAVSSHARGQVASARFRDFGASSSTVLAAASPLSEPLGQSSRLTPVVLSEIMYAPRKRDAADLEFIELANPFGTPEDISGYRLSGDIDYLFPPGTVLAPGAYLVVARNPADVQSVYGIPKALGPYTGSLPKGGGTVRLRHRTGAIFLEVEYGTAAPWPVAASGLGHSLVLARASYGERDPRAWAPSDLIGGSPGRAEGVGYEPLRAVVINEFLAHSNDPLVDFIELYNPGPLSADVSGCRLGDRRGALEEAGSTNLFQIPANTVIPPQGFAVFDQNQLGFALKAEGESIYLVNSNGTRILDALSFDGQGADVSSGRFPDGAPEICRLSGGTPGARNAAMAVSDVVINEIMYAPISHDTADEYVEIYNRGQDLIDVGGWAFTKGISFMIPPNTRIPPDGYLVIAKNTTNLLARYPETLTQSNTPGDYSGTLGNRGERLVLSAPEIVITTNRQGTISTTTIWIAVDEVAYGTGGRWGTWAAGGGSSLELIDPRSDHRRAPNWAGSDETAKAPWTTVSHTGKLDNGDADVHQLQVFLQGAGECLIDDVEVLNASGVNSVANSSFESGADGWTAEGTQEQSGPEASGGFAGGNCYHVRASDRGDTQVNRIRTPLDGTVGSITTIRAKVRWLKGHPEILFRLRGKWLEAEGRMTMPPGLGTPGARNSRSVPNGAPAIFDVTHFPVLPARGEPIRVTARVHDPDGVATVTLNYRIDPWPDRFSQPMLDDGQGGDAVAGDGIFTAVIPGQLLAPMVAFYVEARDARTPSATALFPTDAPARECLASAGDPVQPGNIPTYRFWMTQATFKTWSSRHKLNNTPLDFTFVAGNHRVIYNAQGLFAGSPYIAPTFSTPSGKLCGYTISLPTDDRYLGSDALVLDWAGGHDNERTAVQEQMAYWHADRLDLPFSLRHYIRLTVNGVTDMQRGGVFEAIIQPAGQFLEAWSPDDPDGDLYKIDQGFELDNDGNFMWGGAPSPRLALYTTTGGAKKTARYRWNWLKRSSDSANNYTNLFDLADALNSRRPEPYTSRAGALVDVEEWMRVFAFEHIINNWDSWGHRVGKNMYAYKPERGRWQLYPFDLDWLMLVTQYHDGAGPLFEADDPTVERMFAHPPFLRAYYRAVQDAVDGPMLSENCDPVMDAKYQWLVASGVNRCDGSSQLATPVNVKKWFSDRRGVLQVEVTKFSPEFALSAPAASIEGTNLAALTGVAPIRVKTIEVNGVAYEPTWTTVTNFTLRMPLPMAGPNLLNVQAYDLRGAAITNASASVTIDFSEPVVSPLRQVIFNEIQYSPVVPGGAFIELYNTSKDAAFDLTGWRIDGLDYTFPPGTVLLPDSCLVLAQNLTTFIALYPTILPVGVYGGTLDPEGETLTLVRPATSSEPDLVINRLRYSSVPPWPTLAHDGASLQLIDSTQDNRWPSNWAVSQAAPLATPGAPNSVRASLPEFPALWINEVHPVNAGDVTDTNGHAAPWIEVYNGSSNALSLDGFYLADSLTNMARWAFPPDARINPGEFKPVFADGEPGQNRAAEFHTDFRLSPAGGFLALSRGSQEGPQVVDYLDYPSLGSGRSYGSLPDGQSIDRQSFYHPTPGEPNNGQSELVAVLINEWMASNKRTIADPADENFEDWFELYNAGAAEADLTGYYLTGNLANPSKFKIPGGYRIPAGGFLLVWADDEEGQNQTNRPDLHVNFNLTAAGDAIGLFAPDGTAIDTVTFGPQTTDASEGRSPDGGTNIMTLPSPSPRVRNPGVAHPPHFARPEITDHELTLIWQATPGRTYRVEFKRDLGEAGWQPLAPEQQASSAITTITIPRSAQDSAFYRVVLVD